MNRILAATLLLLLSFHPVTALVVGLDGNLHRNGTVTIDRISIVDASPSMNELGGAQRFSFEILNHAEAVEDERIVTSTFSLSIYPIGEVETDESPFSVRLPLTDESRCLHIRSEDRIIEHIDLRELACTEDPLCVNCDALGFDCKEPTTTEPGEQGQTPDGSNEVSKESTNTLQRVILVFIISLLILMSILAAIRRNR